MSEGIVADLPARPRTWWLLIGLVLLAGALRFAQLGQQELRGDEAFSWNYIAHEAGPVALVERIIREGDPQPPIHYWLLQGWVALLGDSEFGMRSMSALLSVLLVPLVAVFARRATGSQATALLAAALTALHPFQVWLAQDVRNMYQLALLGLLVATLQLPAVLRGRWLALLVYALAGAFAMYSHYYALFGLLAHGAFVLGASPVRRGWLMWLSGGALIGLAVLPWAVVILPVYAAGQLADPTAYPLLDFLRLNLSAAALGTSVASGAGLWGALALVALSAVGVVALRTRRGWGWLAVAWPLIALAGIYAVTRTRATLNAFYFLTAFPAVYLLAAAGLAQLGRWQRTVGQAAAAVVLLGFGFSLLNHYTNPAFSKTRGMREVAATLAAEATPDDVFIANFPDPATVYYLRHLVPPLDYVMLPGGPNALPEAVAASVADLATTHNRLWHVPVRAAQWDADGLVEQALRDNAIEDRAWQHGKLRLLRFASTASALPGWQPLGAVFDGGIVLDGASVQVVDGSVFAVLGWQAAARQSRDLTVFVHAVAPDGMLAGQHDGVPGDGRQPTSGWETGNAVYDRHRFDLDLSFDVDGMVIRVGLYDPATGERLPLADGGDSVVVWP